MEMLAWDSGQNPVPCGNNPYSEYMHYSLYIYNVFYQRQLVQDYTRTHTAIKNVYPGCIRYIGVFFPCL